MKKILAVILAAVTICSLFACAGNESYKGLKVVCTAFPQYDFAKNILEGTDYSLVLLTENGEDLHSYEPTAADIVEIGSSDLFIYVGGTSDEWVGEILKAANNPSLETLSLKDCSSVIYCQEDETDHIHDDEHSHEEAEDEHVWLSFANAISVSEAICGKLCEIDKANASVYSDNTNEFVAELNALDKEYRNTVDSAKRNFLLFADRFPFRYLTESYGIDYFAAFSGCSSESEASFATMAALIDKTKELSLPVVLTIDGSDGSLAKTVCNETGAQAKTLDSCQSVSKTDIENGATYIGIMTSNLEVLREALN